MKLAIRALVLGIAVSGLAASAVSAHMGNTSATVNSHEATLASHQAFAAAMPSPLCDPGSACNIQNGGTQK